MVDKPAGWTSHDVVARVRRLAGTRRVGHAGTLDPMATGVLPLGVGRGTRVIEYLSDADKAYRAAVRLGVTTDTDDAEGRTISENDISALTPEQVARALQGFVGAIEQRAPVYSAIKRAGTPLYALARRGEAVEPPVRHVTIHRISVIAVALPLIEFDVACSKGTYVRSLARDLGEQLGCGAHLAALRRTRSGPFSEADAVTLDGLAGAAENGSFAALLQPPDAALIAMPRLDLNGDAAADLLHGRTIRAIEGVHDALARAYSPDGMFLGIVRAAGGEVWMPEKVFS